MAHYADAPRTATIPLAAPEAANGIHALDRLIWSLIAAVAVMVALAPLAGFSIQWNSYLIPGGAVAVMLMIAATPIDGSHYVIDVLAGLAIALVSWSAAQRIADHAGRARFQVPNGV